MRNTHLATALAAIMLLACDKKNDDLVLPISNFPDVIKLDNEGDGDIEDEGSFSFTLTLNEKVDPANQELSGKIVPLKAPVIVEFEIAETTGIQQLSSYLKEWKASYQVDDCTTSDDLQMEFDPQTGKGTVQFPANVEEVEVSFEVDEILFDDDTYNEERSFAVRLVRSNSAAVAVNNGTSFKYEILDDESVQGSWKLDHMNPAAFAMFKNMFGIANAEIENLQADQVSEIEFSFEYDQLSVVIELDETEMVEACGEVEEENKEIELELEYENFERNSLAGDLEAVGEGDAGEYKYEGSYQVNGKNLLLTLAGEYGENSTDEITLELEK